MKKFKVSPDAWVQLVKQLAFQKMFNRPGVTYESCQTRKYQRGRTEVIRSASNESKAWVEAMLDPDVTVSVDAGLGDGADWMTGRRACDAVPTGGCATPAVCCVGKRGTGGRSAPVWAEADVAGGGRDAGDVQ